MKSTEKGVHLHEDMPGSLFVSNVQGNFDELQDMYMYGNYKQATYRERYANKSKSRRSTEYY